MLSQVLWNSPRSLPVAIVVALVAVIAVVCLYPPQVKGLPFAWRWGLPMLRAGGMLALAAALLKPAVVRPKTAEEQGAVVILVDRSRSMAVADNARTPAQLVALAAGLGRLPEGTRSDRAAAVAAQAVEIRPLLAAADRAAGDLEYARVAGRGVEAARHRVTTALQRLQEQIAALMRAGEALGDATVMERLVGLDPLPSAVVGELGPALATVRAKLDAAAAAAAAVQAAGDEQLYGSDAQVRSACDELARMSRFELTGQALLGRGTGLLSKLRRDLSVVAFAFADELSPLPFTGRAPTLSATAPTTGPAWSTAPALAAVPDGRRSDIAGAVRKALDLYGSRDVAAVVVFSDGRQTGPAGVVTSGLAAAGTPVYAVSVAPPGAVRDVSVTAVTAPESAFVGETATVRAEVRPQGSKDLEGQVKLVAEGIAGEQLRGVKITESRPAVAEFQVKLGRPGAQLLTVSLAPVEGDATGENNSARRWVKVLSQKVKVAAFAALPGWDFQYLRNALSRTPWVELEAAVLNPAAPRVPMTADQILTQDVVVLSDVPVVALDDTQWSAVYRLVSERGGSVILLAGAAHLPAEYGPHLVASSLLPYSAELTPTWRMWPGEVPMFRLVPHPDALNEPVLRIGEGERGASAVDMWQTLPGFYRVLPVGRLKPGAQSLLMEASSGEPVFTQIRVGAGKAFLLGAIETWRWRSGPSEDMHDRFWLQLIRHAAGEPFAARSDRIALDVDRVAFDAGEVVQAKVRAVTGLGPEALRLEVVRDGNASRTVPLVRVGASDSGRFAARLGPFPEGDYQLRLSEAVGAETAGVSVSFQVTGDYQAELADVSGDQSVLARLAESSAGELYLLDDIDRLAERVNGRAERRSGFVEQRLWESPYLFVLVVACFTAEWAARKRLGLA